MLRSLQVSRALAALVVVLHHTNHSIFQLPKYFGYAPLGRLVDFGPAAIDFFFVLSGFIIMYVHGDEIGKPRALASFMWRRFSRVYLFYWFVLAAVVSAYFLIPGLGAGHERDPLVLLTSFLLVPHPDRLLVLVVAWTLVYEVLFYCFFAVLILNKRAGVLVFAGWTAGIVLANWWSMNVNEFVCDNMHLRFLAGVGVCAATRRWTIPAPRWVAGAGVALFLTTGMFDTYGEPISSDLHILIYTLSSCLIIGGLVEAERSGPIGVPRWLVYIGDATYAIYLVHFIALSIFAKVTVAMKLQTLVPLPALFVLFVVGAFGAGLFCHHFIDQPLTRWAKRYFRPIKPVRAATGTEAPVRAAA